jgi:hypothetical protein
MAAFLVTGVFATAPAGAVVGTQSWNLTVDKTWNAGPVSGSGTDGDGNAWSIDCGATCSATINNDCAFDPDFHDVVCEAVPATISAADGNGYAFQYWLGCTSVSGAGNRDCNLAGESDASPYAVFADVEAPSASLTTPASGGLLSGTFSVGADWADNSDNIWSARFYVRKTEFAMSTVMPFSRDFDSTTVGDGPALIEVTVQDTHGNVSAPASATVMIDNNPPSISNFSGPGAGPLPYGSAQRFTWVAADNPGSGIKSVECRLDAAAFAKCDSSSGHSYGELPLGPHTFTLKVTDNAERVATRSATWSIEQPPPAGGSPSEPGSSTSGDSPSADAGNQTPGRPSAVAAVAARVAAKWRVRRGKTRVKKLVLHALPAGAAVEVMCKGTGCPFKAKRFVAKNGSLDLRRRFKKELRRGATITIKITKPGMTGEVIRYVTRKKGAPRQTVRSAG